MLKCPNILSLILYILSLDGLRAKFKNGLKSFCAPGNITKKTHFKDKNYV